MYRRIFLSLSIFLVLSVSASAIALAEETEITIRGKVEKIAEDSSYIIINGTKIVTTESFIANSYFEPGDLVEIYADKKDNELHADNYSYVFDENPDISEDDEQEEATSVSDETTSQTEDIDGSSEDDSY